MAVNNNFGINKMVHRYAPLSIFPVIVLFFFCASCQRSDTEKSVQEVNNKRVKEQLVKVNKAQTYSEQSQINDYLKRYHYPVEESQTGLRYYCYQKTKGRQPGAKSVVVIKYEVTLLDGTVCYSSAENGELEFQIGKTDLPVGLQEGILKMRTGEKAVLITPSRLGYGLTGDGANIPSNAVLVYDVELLKIIK